MFLGHLERLQRPIRRLALRHAPNGTVLVDAADQSSGDRFRIVAQFLDYLRIPERMQVTAPYSVGSFVVFLSEPR